MTLSTSHCRTTCRALAREALSDVASRSRMVGSRRLKLPPIRVMNRVSQGAEASKLKALSVRMGVLLGVWQKATS